LAVFSVLILVAMAVVAHFVGDYYFQKSLPWAFKFFRKEYDKKRIWQLLVHCVSYILPFIPVFLIFEIAWPWLAVLFLSHFAIDRGLRGFKVKNGNSSLGYWRRMRMFDRALVTDQGLHYLFIFIVLTFGVWVA